MGIKTLEARDPLLDLLFTYFGVKHNNFSFSRASYLAAECCSE